MAKTPFKLKSGSNIPFKKMGSSPAKQEQQSSPSGKVSTEKSKAGEAFQKWIKGSEKTGKVMLDRAKKKCAEKGGVWKNGKCVT